MHCRALPIAVAAAFLMTVPAGANVTEGRIQEIRERYTEIESAQKTSVEIKFESEDDPLSGTLSHFKKDGKVVKAVLEYVHGDHSGIVERFYYHDGKLFFAHVTESTWRFTGTILPNGESETMDHVTEFRIYLHNGAVIRNLTKSATAKSGEDVDKALQKAQNKPSSEVERGARILDHARKVHDLKDGAAVLKMLE